MNNNLILVYSSSEIDIINYRKGIIMYYETGNYTFYKDYFLNKQISRILELMPGNEKGSEKEFRVSM